MLALALKQSITFLHHSGYLNSYSWKLDNIQATQLLQTALDHMYAYQAARL